MFRVLIFALFLTCIYGAHARPVDGGVSIRHKISALNSEIARLEAANGQKLKQVYELRQEIRWGKRRSQIIGLFSALMGHPAVTDLDSRLVKLDADLAAIEAARAAIQKRIRDHASEKARLELRLDTRLEAGPRGPEIQGREPTDPDTGGPLRLRRGEQARRPGTP